MVILYFLIPLALLFLFAFIIDLRAKKRGRKIDFDRKSHLDPYAQAEADQTKNMIDINRTYQ